MINVRYMCNKRRKLINHNCLMPLFLVTIALLLNFALTGCEEKIIHTYDFNAESFKSYEDAVQNRSYSQLMELTADSNPDVRRLAWLALSNTEIEDPEEFYEAVKHEDNMEPWLALSLNQISESKWEELYSLWESNEINRDGVCLLMSRQGDSDMIQFLLENEEYLLNSSDCSLAIGKIIARTRVDLDMAYDIMNLAFNVEAMILRRNLIYGFYRSRIVNFKNDTNRYKQLLMKWESQVGLHPEVDQMMMRILGEDAMDIVAFKWFRGGYEDNYLILLEMLRSMVDFQLYDANPVLFKALLSSDNHHVKSLTLDLLVNTGSSNQELRNWIAEEITGPTRDPELFVKSLTYLVNQNYDISAFRHKLENFAEKSELIYNRAVPLLMHYYEFNEFVDFLFEKTKTEGPIGLFSLNRLVELYKAGELNENDTNRFKKLIEDDVIYAGEIQKIGVLASVLEERGLFTDDEIFDFYNYIVNNDFNTWKEFYFVFVRVMHYRFGEDVKDELVTLKEIDNFRFSKLLSFAFEDLAIEGDKFHQVDWVRLTELGKRPYWILNTTRGKIEIELDPLTAPFTVSAIDSLTRAGKYNDIPFHRVIPNFVVQSGDYIIKTGAGVPLHTLPTEPSILSFKKGEVGIASTGNDTEGSQFFIMVNWGPHLDGIFTNFGSVIRGMEIVERIQLGDKILEAYVEPR